MEFQQLLEIAEFEYYKSLIEVVNQNNETFQMFRQQTDKDLKVAVDREYLLSSRILEIENNFFNGKPNIAGIVSFPEATPLVIYGFEVVRENPNLPLQTLINTLEQTQMFDKFWDSYKPCLFLASIDVKYGSRKINELTQGEALIEALHYIIEGGNFAIYLKYLHDLKNGKIENYDSDRTLIKWKGENKNDLAYLFWKLQKEEIISIGKFGKTLSRIFIDENDLPIENTLFNKYSSEFNRNQFPANASKIDKLIACLKKS